MRTKLNEIIKNGHLGMIAVFFIVYMITFSYIEDRDVHHYIIHTTIDDQIPFCEYFIVPYLLWFLFVAVTVFYFMFFNNESMERILSADHNTWNRHDPVFDHLISISEWTGSKTSSYWRQHFYQSSTDDLSHGYSDECTSKYPCI